MTSKAEAAVIAPVRVPENLSLLARMCGLTCTLVAVLSFSACSILPAEHAPNPSVPAISLIARTSNSLTFKFRAYQARGTAPAGLTLWLGEKERTIISPSIEYGTTVIESTPEGLYWTTDWPAEGVLGKAAHLRQGPIQLNDFAFRPDPMVWDAFGRLAIADGARPGSPKMAIYLSISNLAVGAK